MYLYNLPAYVISSCLIALVLASSIEMLIALKIVDTLTHVQEAKFIRNYYTGLMIFNLSLLAEFWIAISGVESGAYLYPLGLFRFFSPLPAVILAYGAYKKIILKQYLEIHALCAFMPLLLAFVSNMTILFPFRPLTFIILFAVACMTTDAILMLFHISSVSRNNLSFDAISEVIFKLDAGICLLDSKARVIEFNPAFIRQCKRLNIPLYKKSENYIKVLRKMAEVGKIMLEETEEHFLVQYNGDTFIVIESAFQSGGRAYHEILVNDVTSISVMADEIKKENLLIEKENMRLKETIKRIEEEAAYLEREKLYSRAHDIWSQRLAIAGLSVDTILKHEFKSIYNAEAVKNTLRNLFSMLAAPEEYTALSGNSEFTASLNELARMYANMGVTIHQSDCLSKMNLPANAQKALIPILKESFANAVRHAYAKDIYVDYEENGEFKTLFIRNICFNECANVIEGRGLHDIKERASKIGAEATYVQGKYFELAIKFPS